MIFNAASLSALVLCALASLGSVSAVPSPFEYPEVIPGPGMPSLASLGLTSKDLYVGTAPLGKRELLESRFTRICTDNGCGRVPRGDAQACINYLRNLGTQLCVVPGPTSNHIVMCTAGQASVSGNNYNFGPGGGSVSSYCSDVAAGGQSVVDNCTDGNGLVAGADAANGNGDLIVAIEHTGC